jgi:hypothetical protein
MFRILFFFTFYLFFSYFITSCKSDKKNIIPKEEFEEILYDLSKADGILEDGKYNDNELKNDSLSYYNYIYQKHKITRQQYNESIKYYADNIADFQNMIENVNKRINEEKEDASLDADLSDKPLPVKDSNDIWNQRNFYSIPDDGGNNIISINIEAKNRGTYTLSADIKIFLDDNTVNPRMTLEMHYDDNNQASSSVNLIKDAQWHHYSLPFTTYETGGNLKYLGGAIINNSKTEGDMHVEVKNIQMVYTKQK